ncbi:hypothetical protein [Streptomyces griseoluteus]
MEATRLPGAVAFTGRWTEEASEADTFLHPAGRAFATAEARNVPLKS